MPTLSCFTIATPIVIHRPGKIYNPGLEREENCFGIYAFCLNIVGFGWLSICWHRFWHTRCEIVVLTGCLFRRHRLEGRCGGEEFNAQEPLWISGETGNGKHDVTAFVTEYLSIVVLRGVPRGHEVWSVLRCGVQGLLPFPSNSRGVVLCIPSLGFDSWISCIIEFFFPLYLQVPSHPRHSRGLWLPLWPPRDFYKVTSTGVCWKSRWIILVTCLSTQLLIRGNSLRIRSTYVNHR